MNYLIKSILGSKSYGILNSKLQILNSKLVQIIVIMLFTACHNEEKHAAHATPIHYTCPMHPQIIQDKPGTCPICGMDLVKVTSGESTSITLTENQIKLANITTALVQEEEIANTTILTGKLVVSEEQTEVVSSRVQGRIEKLFIKEVGQRIEQGQSLYEMYSEQLLTLQQEYLLALQQYEELGQKEKRYESFKTAAEKKLLLLGMTQAQVVQLSKIKRISARIFFVAPVTGVVTRIDVAEGQSVAEGGSLYRIERLDNIWVETDLYPKEASLVKVGDEVNVVISGFENKTVKGKVNFLSPEYRQGTQIITLRALIQNHDKLYIPGMQANIVLAHSGKKTMVLPIKAVIRDEEGSHIWIVNENGTFSPRMVQTGLENADKIEITAGLRERENVVVTGAYLLYSDLVLKKGGDPMAGHSH